MLSKLHVAVFSLPCVLLSVITMLSVSLKQLEDMFKGSLLKLHFFRCYGSFSVSTPAPSATVLCQELFSWPLVRPAITVMRHDRMTIETCRSDPSCWQSWTWV